MVSLTQTKKRRGRRSIPVEMSLSQHQRRERAVTDIVRSLTKEAVAVNSVAERYKRLWHADSWPVMAGCIAAWLLDGIVLAGVFYLGNADTRKHDVRVVHTFYSLAIYFLHVSYLLSPLTATKFSALIMAGNVGVFTCSLAITAPAAIFKYQGILFGGDQQMDHVAAVGTAAAWVQIMLVLGAATGYSCRRVSMQGNATAKPERTEQQNGTLLESTPTAWKTHSTEALEEGIRTGVAISSGG
jgi:hypothetical protein